MAAVEYLTVEHINTKDLIRIFSKISIDPAQSWNGTPCWTWNGYRDGGGYGVIHALGQRHQAHRLFFAWLVAPIPRGRFVGEIDHLCRRRACTNPLHLEYVPPLENLMRRHGKTTSEACFAIPPPPPTAKDAIPMLRVEHVSLSALVIIFSKITIGPALSWNNTPCWQWTATLVGKGYGRLWHKGHPHNAHRFMFAWLIHSIPKGQQHGEIDHLCRRMLCCNPVHLEFVNSSENNKRKPLKALCRKTLHTLDGDNLIIDKNGGRACRACRSIGAKTRWQNSSQEDKAKHYESVKEWRLANSEHIKEQARRYASTAKAKEQQRAWVISNRDKVNATARAGRLRNRDKINARQQKWRSENPEEYKTQTRRNNQRRYTKHAT